MKGLASGFDTSATTFLDFEAGLDKNLGVELYVGALGLLGILVSKLVLIGH